MEGAVTLATSRSSRRTARALTIIRAVRRCPSGVLGFGLEGVEVRECSDIARPATVEVSKDGPYRLTGGISVVDENGIRVPRNKGASIKHASLCRCGSSLNKPFCSGMHWSVTFTDPVADPGRESRLPKAGEPATDVWTLAVGLAQ